MAAIGTVPDITMTTHIRCTWYGLSPRTSSLTQSHSDTHQPNDPFSPLRLNRADPSTNLPLYLSHSSDYSLQPQRITALHHDT